MEKLENKSELKKILQMSLFLSLSIVLQILESTIMLPIFLPGIKLGLSNIVIIIVLYKYSLLETLKLGILKVFVVGLIRTGLGLNFIFSLVGVIFSILVSGLLKKTNKFSIIGISIVGSNFHIIGQILVASLVYKTKLLYVTYLPYMLLVSIISGGIIGYFAKEIMERVEIEKY